MSARLRSLLGALALLSLPAAAAPDPAAELVLELQDRARSGTLDAAWIQAHVDPGPAGWTTGELARWRRVLAPGSALPQALQRATGVAHVARGQGPTRVVLEGAPHLAVEVEEPGLRIRAVDVTSCVACDERLRFVQDLLADVRRTGSLGAHLRPGLELDVSEHHARDGARWPAWLDTYLQSDARVARALAAAVVTGREGDVVRLRYADGHTDTWRVRWQPGKGWQVAYVDLAARSPLRLEDASVRTWIRDDSVQEIRTRTWRPGTARDGASLRLGHGAVAAVVDPLEDRVWIVARDVDGSLQSAFLVDPQTSDLLARVDLPDTRGPTPIVAAAWATRWPAALSPDGAHLALASPNGLVVVDTRERTVTSTATWTSEVTDLAWRPDGLPTLVLADGRLVRGEEVIDLPVRGHPLAVADDGREASVITSAGELVRVVGGDARVERTVCGGLARAGAWRARDGAWLVACAPGSPLHHVVVAPYGGAEQRQGGVVPATGPVAWSADGERCLLPGPEGLGVEIWDAHARTSLGLVGDVALAEAAFAGDGSALVTVSQRGEVRWWTLAQARRPGPRSPGGPR
ncbi:MAG: hypothetical protein H6732_01275 [Alphaproteobacteria bacterium]|nr:hypothetical protein [Alphaproteobacteria bacterium]